jgi:hypothetical protein
MIAASFASAAKNLARGLEKRECLTLPLRALDRSFEEG